MSLVLEMFASLLPPDEPESLRRFYWI